MLPAALTVLKRSNDSLKTGMADSRAIHGIGISVHESDTVEASCLIALLKTGKVAWMNSLSLSQPAVQQLENRAASPAFLHGEFAVQKAAC